MAVGRRSWRFIVVAVAAIFAAACYLPDDFEAEIRIGADGSYAITYDGLLTWVPLYGDIKRRTVTGMAAVDKVADIERDLRRDNYFTEVRSLNNGQFRVRYDRHGKFKKGEPEMISFVRRNAIILYIKMDKDGKVTIAGNTPRGDRAKDLAALGLGVHGRLRVTTAAYVTENNARTAGEHGPFKTYDWQIDSSAAAKSPKLTLQLR